MIRLVVIISLFYYSISPDCSLPYALVSTLCTLNLGIMNISTNEAIDICHDNKGRLPTLPEMLIAHAIKPKEESTKIHIAVTDAMKERNTSQFGWQNFNGSVVNIDYTKWNASNPYGVNRDCIIDYGGKLFDTNCNDTSHSRLICIYEPDYDYNGTLIETFKIINANNETFNRDNGGMDKFEEIISDSKNQCCFECLIQNPKCKGVFFDVKSGRCVLTHFLVEALPTLYDGTDHEWLWYSYTIK